MAAADPDANLEEVDEEERVKQIEEAHLAESLERLILEAYKLLQQGEMAQAESLLQEGKMLFLYFSLDTKHTRTHADFADPTSN